MVGDRPSTDGALADALGWPFALVLSGVTAAVAPPGGEAIPSPPLPTSPPTSASSTPARGCPFLERPARILPRVGQFGGASTPSWCAAD